VRVRVRVRACACVHVRVCVCACVRACVRALKHTNADDVEEQLRAHEGGCGLACGQPLPRGHWGCCFAAKTLREEKVSHQSPV